MSRACFCANNNLHVIDLFAGRGTTRHTGPVPGRILRFFTVASHCYRARIYHGASHAQRYFSQTAAGCWHFLIRRGEARGEETYGVRAAESRGCASHLSLAAAAGHPPRALTKGYIYMCRRDRRRAIVGGYHCLRGYCHRHVRACGGRGECRSLTARVPLIRNGRTYGPAHYLPARRTRTEIIDKGVLACIEMQRLLSYSSFVFLRCTWYPAYMHINAGEIIPSPPLHFLRAREITFLRQRPWQRDRFLTCVAPI